MNLSRTLLLLGALVIAAPAWSLNILATVPEWGALAKEIGGDKVNVYTATTALQDPHRVEAKPSLVARARSADLLIATGAELEVGWVPIAQRESGNGKIQPGSPGYFEAARFVRMLDVPAAVDRSMGDVHPQGNPHIQLNPHNIAQIAQALAKRMAQLEPATAAAFDSQHQAFQARWKEAITRWEAQAAPLRGMPVLVVHQDSIYLLDWLGMKQVGALEPKPGIPPATGHMSELLKHLTTEPAKMILRPAYASPKAAEWMAEHAKIPVVLVPFSVGGTDTAKDLFGLFDDTISRLLAAAK